MLYFKHSELVDTYHVSLKTVHNWIDATKTGKLNLDLVDNKGRTYIANKPANITALQKLSQEGKKYRNARYQKVIRPKKEFYDIFSRRQTLDLISSLTIHREIPHKYNYLDGGANNWDSWVLRLADESGPNMIHNTIDLVNSSLDSIDSLLKGREKINVIDLGVGNAMPVNDLIGHLLKRGALNRYIGIDISQSMLDIAERNLKKWYGEDFRFEGYVRDFSYERFDDLLVDDMLDSDDGKILNLVLLFGSTPLNFRNPNDALRAVYGSMGENDLLVFTCKPDTEASRRYFDYRLDEEHVGLSPIQKFVPNLLNIDDSLYDVETGYNEQKRMRYIRIRLKTAIVLEFEFEHAIRRVSLEKGDAVLLLRIWHQTALETINEFEKVGFILLRSNMTKDRERLLTVSGIDTYSDSARP
jgi:SAM-dependent methyltransferase